MLKSYWISAWRMLVRHKVYTLVNVLGLALGICACLVIWAIVHYEFSFDRDHPDRDLIYRVNSYEQYMKSEPEHMVPAVLPQIAPLIGKEVPGIGTVAPYELFGNSTAAVAGARAQKKEYPSSPVIAGPEYFRIMPDLWLAGNEQNALVNPFGVVLTQKKARLYFGTGPLEAMIGREIVYSDSLRVHVAGIVRDWSGHTDFPYEEFISWPTMEHSWLWEALGMDPSVPHKGIPFSSRLLVKLGPKADPEKVGAVLAATAAREGWNGKSVKRIVLQPLSEIHFSPAGDEGAIRTSQLSTLYSLMSIALFILVLAIINYVNLATAQSLTREKEISIRKVMGGGRTSLMLQLLAETFLLTALAGLVAVSMVSPVLHAFRQFVPQGLSFEPWTAANLLFLVGIMIVTTLLAGLYPAKLLSAHSPVDTLKGAGAPPGEGKWWLRKGLIVFQFTVSSLFIIGTMVIGRQIGFMLNKDLGFRSDAMIEFNTDERSDSVGKVKVLEAAIGGLPGVAGVARENMPPMGTDEGIFGVWYRPLGDERIAVDAIKVDEHYIPLYGIRLLAGRNLLPSDTIKEIVINESLSKRLGFRSPDEAVGKMVNTWGKEVPIVGVVADFHKFSFHEPIQPLMLACMACMDIAVRLDTKGQEADVARAILGRIEKQWKGVYPHRPFEYSFLDEEIAHLYQREQTMEWLMNIATAITVFISCIGLFGLTLFTTKRRTREIGIRKVLGAGVGDILVMLGRDFVVLVGIGLVIASAAGWWLMQRWLQDYAYRVGVGFDVFLLAGGLLVVVTVLTVGAQSLRAALTNPVRSLRVE